MPQRSRIRLFQDFDFGNDFKDSRRNNKKVFFLIIFGSFTVVPTSWMCKKKKSVSEAEFIFDADLHMDGIPAVTFRDFVMEVFPFEAINADWPKGKPRETRQQSSSQTCIQAFTSFSVHPPLS